MLTIGRTQQLLGDLSDERRLFRPFGGRGKLGKHLLNRSALNFLLEGKYTCVLWNVIPADWEDPDGWVERALEQCAAIDWALVVLHDIATGAMDHLERFIELAAAGGATFVQDFPPECVPLVRGHMVTAMDRYVADPGT